MYTCGECGERLWDDLYGLLETDESAGVRNHLASCPACQAEKAKAEAQRRLLSTAARLEVAVPPFVPPEAAEETAPSRPIILSTSRPVHRPSRRWLVAVAALFVVALPYGLYRAGLARYQTALVGYQTALVDAETSLAATVAHIEEFHRQAKTDADSLALATRANHLHVQVLGPADYQPGAPCQYHVITTDLNGNASEAKVTARVVDEVQHLFADAEDVPSPGNVVVSLTPKERSQPRGPVFLQVAIRGKQLLQLQRPLAARGGTLTTELVLDRLVYRPGERVFFRSLTLDSCHLRPTLSPVKLAYLLTDPMGKTVSLRQEQIHEGGVGSGFIDLRRDQPEGEYILKVTEVDGPFVPVEQKFLVRHQEHSTNRESASANPSDTLHVEFFPEGGKLIAGVPNRIYFSARTSQGEAADLEGRIVDGQGQPVVASNTLRPKIRNAPGAGLGVFTLTPKGNETYQLQFPSRALAPVAIPLPAVVSSGLALSVPASVIRAGEPIRVRLQYAGAEQEVLVGLLCRGRLLAQRMVLLHAGTEEVELTPPANCQGVLRVAAFGPGQGIQQPIAERFIYCRPANRLALSVEGLKERYAPGERVSLAVRSEDGRGTPERSWLAVSIVDEQRAPANATRTGPAYFLLAAELELMPDPEAAAFLVSDDPQAAPLLDLYLGAQRMSQSASARNPATVADKGSKSPYARLVKVMKLDNRAQALADAAAAAEQALAELSVELAAHEKESGDEARRRLERVTAASRGLDDYQAKAAEMLRVGLGFGILLAFAFGSLLLIVALVRLLRGLAANVPYFAGAFAALSVCLATILSPANPWNGGPQIRHDQHAHVLPKPVGQEELLETAGIRALREQLAKRNVPTSLGPKVLPFGELPSGAIQFGEEQIVATKIDASSPMNRPVPSKPMIAPFGPKSSFKPSGSGASMPEPRDYVYSKAQSGLGAKETPIPTIVWLPEALATDGTAKISFDLPERPATYRLRVEGHAFSGGLGFVETKLHCRPAAETGK